MTLWVALTTFEGRAKYNSRESVVEGVFFEEGGIYAHEPSASWGTLARELVPGEHEAACIRCGQRFANSDESTAEANRDLHFYGDADCPSICRDDDNEIGLDVDQQSPNPTQSQLTSIR